KTMTIRSTLPLAETRPSRGAGGRSGGGRGGNRGGVGVSGGGTGRGRTGRSSGGTPSPGNPNQLSTHDYKITVNGDTVIEDEKGKIAITDLRVGDEVIVSGIPKGGEDKLEATQISRSKR